MWPFAAAVVFVALMVGGLPHWSWMAKLDLGFFPPAMMLALLIALAIMLLSGVV